MCKYQPIRVICVYDEHPRTHIDYVCRNSQKHKESSPAYRIVINFAKIIKLNILRPRSIKRTEYEKKFTIELR